MILVHFSEAAVPESAKDAFFLLSSLFFRIFFVFFFVFDGNSDDGYGVVAISSPYRHYFVIFLFFYFV